MATKRSTTRSAAPRSAKRTTKTKSAAKSAAATKSAAKTAAAKRRASAQTRTVARPVKTRSAANAVPVRVPRRAVFIDVENTSSEERLFEVLDSLQIDRAAQPTQVTAVGNWRAIGQRLGRRLGSMGAQLVHSAPATGVRDWSDLWIAVAAGCWLGRAEPGDCLDIVSNDRAFDAVGDAAASLGVAYRRLLLRRGAAEIATTTEHEPERARRSRGGRRRRGRGTGTPAAPRAIAPAAPAPPAPVPFTGEPHGASAEQMLSLIARLTAAEPGRWLNLDVLEKGLKAQGFSRPPGSPRLVTRLRALKDVEIDAHGRVRLVNPAAHVAHMTEPSRPPPPKRRRRRRGASNGATSEPPAVEALSESAVPAADESPAE